MTTRHLFGLVLIALAPSLGCDPELKMDTKRAFAEHGLQVRETHLLHYDDGVTVDRRHAGRKALRTRGAAPRRELTQVLARPSAKIVTKSLDEIVLFSGQHQASSFFAAHGIDDDEPIDGLVVAIPAGGDGWLTPPVAPGRGFTSRSDAVDAIVRLGTRDALSSGLTGGGGGGIPEGPGGLIGGGGSVTRYVMNDELPLRASPNFVSATLMEMQRGDRVFVYGSAPVNAAGNLFVQVQAVDRSPYPVGWMPLHWLMVSPAGDVQTTLDFGASYGLIAHVAKDFIKDSFYDHCDSYPRYPQDDIFGTAPQLVNPGSIPYAHRYLCGEMPIGEIQSSDWKLLTNYEFTTPEQDIEVAGITVFHADELDFQVPVMLYRLPWQTRKNYSKMDLSSGYAQGGVDSVEHSMYAKFADAIKESAVRVHDTDFWFNVTWSAPAGVTPVAGASGYFNFCWTLPGGKLEGGYAPLDITIEGAINSSHITGVTWGAVEYSAFRACGTAALRNDPSNIKGDLTTGQQPPIRVQFVRASLKGLSLKFVELPHLYGSFAAVHAGAIGLFLDFVSSFAKNEGVMGVLWEAFMRESLEERLAGYLFELGTDLAQRMPDPKNELADACDTLMPGYSSPTSRYYPMYQHCVEAASSASVSYFTNTTSPSTACYAGHSARANDGSAWSSKKDDHHTYYAPPNATPVGLDKPFWVDGCEVEAELQTTVMSGYEDLVECAGAVFDEGVNYRRSMSWIQTQLQSRCLTPTVGFLCDAYGEGDDLVELWTQQLGVQPNVGGIFGFCGWYEELTTEDGPDYHTP
jgi:hypothetical protein